MPLVLALDFKTTGPDPTTDMIFDFAAAGWDTGTRHLIYQHGATTDDLHEQLDSISPATVFQYPSVKDIITDSCFSSKMYVDAVGRSLELVNATYVIALDAHIKRAFLTQYESCEALLNLKWIDFATDLPYPLGLTDRTLNGLAAAHGIVNLFPGQAASDVQVILKILSQYDFKRVEKFAKTNEVTISCVTRSESETKLAQMIGFQWVSGHSHLYATVKAPQEKAFRQHVIKFLPNAFNHSYN